MTFFRKPITLRSWLFSKEGSLLEKPWVLLSAFFLILLVHGSTMGLTDDEAYHWVLGRHFALGFAYHPPAVLWIVRLSQLLWGWLFPLNAPIRLRLPSALITTTLLAMTMHWLALAGAPVRSLNRRALIVASFAGLFGMGWMLVPDMPLFLGLLCALIASWKICFHEVDGMKYFWLALGVAVALLGKFSGCLVPASAGLAILIWAPRDRVMKSFLACLVGLCVALVPILIWNSEHAWGSILFQVSERHGDAKVSWIRYLRFWGVSLIVVGIPAFFAFFRLFGKRERSLRFLWIWALPPALIFCIQPLYSDFKPHWAFVVWLPLMMGFALFMDEMRGLARAQIAFGGAVFVFVLLSCHFPIGLRFVQDPRLDVTDDLYGWSDLPEFLREKGIDLGHYHAVVGSRYQTAAQAGFAMAGLLPTTLLPRDLKSRDDWEELGVSDSWGPDWPRLRAPVLYVADIRYEDGPEFKGADCRKIGRLEKKRGGILAKWIDVWGCEPS